MHVDSPASWISFQQRDAGADSIIFMLSASAWATLMKTKCMHGSHKHQEINKTKVPKPNESALIIKSAASVAPSARPFSFWSAARLRASVSQSRGPFPATASRRPPPWQEGKFAEEASELANERASSPARSHFLSLPMICDPVVDSEIVKPRTHNFSLNLHYSHHNRASHSISKC